MPFPGAFGTSLAAVLGGQTQSNAASAAYAEQIRERQLEEQYRSAALMQQLQAITKQNEAIGRLPQNEQDILNAGGTMADVLKLRSEGGEADIVSSLLGASPQDRPKILAAAVRANPGLVNQLPELTKIAGITAKQGGALNPVYARAMTDNNLTDESQLTPKMLTDAYQKIQTENSALIAGRTPPQIVQIPGYDSEGRPTSTPELVNKRGGTASLVTTSSGAPLTGLKTSPTEGKTIATIQSVLPQLQDLKAQLQSIGPDRWNRNAVQRALAYGNAKYRDVLPDDPALAAVTSQLIQVEAQAQAALLSSAGTRAYSFITNSRGHIPTANGDYNSILTNINQLTGANGPYRSTLRAYGVTGTISPEKSEASDMPPPNMIPEGTKRQFSNGKTYQNVGGSVSEVP